MGNLKIERQPRAYQISRIYVIFRKLTSLQLRLFHLRQTNIKHVKLSLLRYCVPFLIL
jgi:hypothetical protein